MAHLNVKVDDDLLLALDQYQVQNGLETRSQAVRHLLRLMLVSSKTLTPKQQTTIRATIDAAPPRGATSRDG